MAKILCVEDTSTVRLIIEASLKGHQVFFAESMKEAMDLLGTETFSLVLLDVGLPDGNGLEIAATMSDRLAGIPFIFLTGNQEFTTKVSAFSLGAEDFILKPFDPRDLKLRVEAKLRKYSSQGEAAEVLNVGSLICNIQEQRLYKRHNHEPIELTSLEFRIFLLLARTPNKIFARTEILDRVWGNVVSVADRAVDVHVSNLRKKLNGTDVSISAVVGSGYKLEV